MTQLLSPGLGEPLIALARRNTDGIFHTNRLIGRNPGLVLAWRGIAIVGLELLRQLGSKDPCIV
jgi:hypothetical protein